MTRGKWIALIVVLVVAAGVVGYRLASPSDDPRPEVAAAAAEIVHADGEGGEVVTLLPESSNGRLVAYAHGHEQDARDVYADPELAGVAAALLDAGYTVLAADAGGNNWGNEAGVSSYMSAVEDAQREYDLDATALMVESMGALAGLPAATEVGAGAVVAWYPVCDASSVADDEALGESIDESGVDVDTVSPVAMPDVPAMIWASPDDSRVPIAENAEVCFAQSAGGAELVRTKGDHGDPSNFDPDAVVTFLDRSLG